MKKKKQQAKKSKTTKSKKILSSPKKRAAPKAKVAPKKKAVSKNKPAKGAKTASPKRGAERREFRRVQARNLWVTELSGDYQFVAQARDISEGGIFLTGRLKTSQTPSILRLQINGQSLELTAQPVYDQVSKGAYGTGYRFLEVSVSQAKTLRGLLTGMKSQ